MRSMIATLALTLACAVLATAALADELTAMIQKDLQELGYEPGNTRGELDTMTAVAISRYQAEKGLDVTGEPSPQLAGILSAQAQGGGSGKPASTSRPPARTAEELRAAQQACLQEKIAAREASEKKKRGMGSLLRAATRVAGRIGGVDLTQVSRDIYDADATIDDLSSAAEDLDLSESDIEECRNP